MTILSAVLFLVALSLMVLAHELGHFILAKRAGVRVEEFGFGFPPRLFVLKRGETEYSINLIPLGGFCRMLGEEDPTSTRSFAAASKRWRIAILAAGAIMNLVLAALLFSGAFAVGWPTATQTEVKTAKVFPDSPAEKAGLQAGDVVLSVGGQPVASATDIRPRMQENLGKETSVVVRRDSTDVPLTLVPREVWPKDQGPVGISVGDSPTKVELVSYPIWDALVMGTRRAGEVVMLTLYVPVMILRGQLPLELARPVGPVGMYQVTAQAAAESVTSGWWFPFLSVAALLSAGLGVANLFPIPGLDGGRLLFVIIEAIRGRRVSPEREAFIHMLGLGLVVSLVLVVTYWDILAPMPPIDWSVK